MNTATQKILLTCFSIFSFTLLLINSTSAQSYQFAKSISGSNNENGISIALDALGNSYITGTFQGTADFDPGAGTANLTAIGGDDIFFAKYDANGNYVFAKKIGSNSDDSGNKIVVDQNGNCYITGYYWGTADFDPSPNVVNLTPVAVNDIFFAKYDSNGNYIYAKSIGSSGNDIGYGIVVDDLGNCYITGFFQGPSDFNPGSGTATLSPINGNQGIYFAKYDANGNYIYANSISTSIAGLGHGIGIDANGNCYITGTFWGTADFDPDAGTANLYAPSGWNVYLACYDASGDYVFANSICNASGNNNYGIVTDELGNCFLSGSFNSASDFDPGAGIANLTPIGSDDIYFAKYNSSGNYMFAKSIGSANLDGANDIAIDAAGNCYITGWFQDTVDFNPDTLSSVNIISNGVFDIYFAKYDTSGNYVYAKTIGSTGYDNGGGIALDQSGNCYLTGNFSFTSDFDPGVGISNLTALGNADMFVAKYGSINTSLPTLFQDLDFTLSPNPCHGKFYINTPNLNPIQMNVFNFTGQLVFHSDACTEEIDLSTQSKGVYFIQLISAGQSICRKIIIE